MAVKSVLQELWLTFYVFPGDGGLGPADRQAEEVHVVALVDRFILRDVDYPRWHCENKKQNSSFKKCG